MALHMLPWGQGREPGGAKSNTTQHSFCLEYTPELKMRSPVAVVRKEREKRIRACEQWKPGRGQGVREEFWWCAYHNNENALKNYVYNEKNFKSFFFFFKKENISTPRSLQLSSLWEVFLPFPASILGTPSSRKKGYSHFFNKLVFLICGSWEILNITFHIRNLFLHLI